MKRILAFILVAVLMLSLFACGGDKPTDTIKIEKSGVLMIAHRGLSGLEKENTDSAFVAAGERSYYGIEADVRRTADGKFVICHDEKLKMGFLKKRIDVEGSTLEELLAIDLPTENEGEYEHLTDLDSYIEICKRYDKQVILELKSEFTNEEITSIISILKAHNYLERVTFISFYYEQLQFIREQLPDQPLQFLTEWFSNRILRMLVEDKIDIAISHKRLTNRVMRKLKEAGIKVNCWTVDDARIAQKLIDMGVDYITTNILE